MKKWLRKILGIDSELENIAKEQQSKINELTEKLIAAKNDRMQKTFIPLPDKDNPEQYQSYIAALHGFYQNEYIRAFFLLQERELLKRFKIDPSKDGDLYKGGLLLLESMRSDLDDLSVSYRMLIAQKEQPNG